MNPFEKQAVLDQMKGKKPKAHYDPTPGKVGLDRTRKLLPSEYPRAGRQPDWVCQPCGLMYGARVPTVATWHRGVCGCCHAEVSVTEPRDFGYLSMAWYWQPTRESEPLPEPEVSYNECYDSEWMP